MTIGHSSTIDLRMYINGTLHPLQQVAPEWVSFTENVDKPPCDGVVITVIDGEAKSRKVRLPNGVNPDDWRTRIETIGGDE